MAIISKDDLDGRADSVYRIVLLAARRARDRQEEALRVPLAGLRKPTVIALEEIASGKLGYKLWQEEDGTK